MSRPLFFLQACMLATTVRGETFYVSLEGHDHLPGGHYPKDYQPRRRREFLDFMNEVVAAYQDQEIDVILDNLNTHRPKEDWSPRQRTLS